VRFDPAFLERDPLLRTLSPAAAALGPLDDFPEPARLDAVFRGEPPVRFVAAAPRRRGAPLDVRALYDARITLDREVPTRPRCWHDLMNALVWGTFPRAKRALHERQHRAIAARIAPGSRTLPPTRSSELDALALLDEGGIVVLSTRPQDLRAAAGGDRKELRRALTAGEARAIVFGHAIYESLVLGVRPAIVAAVVLREADGASWVEQVDAALSAWLREDGSATTPRDLARVDLDVVRAGPSSPLPRLRLRPAD
jgi:hypothetical protein